MDSIWTQTVRQPSFSALSGDKKTDVLIIGGGITGILCAYMLHSAGVDCTLIEADRLCGGITEDTTAKITLQHGAVYDRMIRRFGADTARLYLNAQQDALCEYERICAGLDCDYERRDSYVFSRTDRRKLEKETAALESLGCRAEFTEHTSLPFSVAGAVRVRHQAQFHPLKFAFSLAQGLPIYEHTKALELLPDGAVTQNGKISCKKIIVATHFPILNKHGAYFLKMYQHRSYVLALRNAADVDGMYVDEDVKGLSFRNYGGLLLLGGGSHRTGKTGGGWQLLSNVAAHYYPRAAVAGRWATQDCMTLDDIPYVGQYSSGTPDLYVATGYNKWGMTNAMAAAKLLCRLIKGENSDYSKVFSPSRSILRPRLALNAAQAVIGLVTPCGPRCPHMGCVLKYNPQEHSWDCPCHGSRFSDKGELIDNPATDDKQNLP